MNFDELAKQYGYDPEQAAPTTEATGATPEQAVSKPETSGSNLDALFKEYGYNPNEQTAATTSTAQPAVPERPYDAVRNRYEGETDEERTARTEASNRSLAKGIVRGVENVAMNTLALPVQAANAIVSYAGGGDDFGRPLLNTMTRLNKEDDQAFSQDRDVAANPGLSTTGGILGAGIGMAPQMVAQGVLAPARAVAGLGMVSRAGAAIKNTASNALQNIALGFTAGGEGDYSKGIVSRGDDAATAGAYSVLADIAFGAAGKAVRAVKGGPKQGLLDTVAQETAAVPGALQTSVDDVAAARRVGVNPNILEVSNSPTLQNTAAQMDAPSQLKMQIQRQQNEAAVKAAQKEQIDFMVPQGQKAAFEEANALYTKVKPQPVPKEVQTRIFTPSNTPGDEDAARIISAAQSEVDEIFRTKQYLTDKERQFGKFEIGVDDVALKEAQQELQVNQKTINRLLSNKPITGPDGKRVLSLEERTAELNQLNAQQERIQQQVNLINSKLSPAEQKKVMSDNFLSLGEVQPKGTVGYLDAVQKQISFGIESTISKQLKTPSASLTKAKQKLLGELDIAFPEYAKARRTYSAAKLNQWAESKLATKRTAAGAQELNFSQQNQALWGSAKNINYWKDEIADIVTDPAQQKEALSKFDDIIRATRVLEKSPIVSKINQTIDDSIGAKVGKLFTGSAVGGLLAVGGSLANSGGEGFPIVSGFLGAAAGALLQGKMNKQMLKLLTDPKYIDIIHKGAIKSNKIDIVTKLQSLARAIMTAKAVYEKENGPMDAQEGTPNANQNTALPGQVPTDQPTQP